jgi:hypothetical protein
VSLCGRDILLGKHGSRESRDNYGQLIAEWMAAGRQLPADPHEVKVAEVVAAFRKHAQTYYRSADGTVSRATVNIDEALRQVLKLYARTPAVEFGPLHLKAVRDLMIKEERVRTNINRHMTRIRQVFKLAVENEIIAATIHHALMAISGLRAGRCGVKESEPVKPVSSNRYEFPLMGIYTHASPPPLNKLANYRP